MIEAPSDVKRDSRSHKEGGSGPGEKWLATGGEGPLGRSGASGSVPSQRTTNRAFYSFTADQSWAPAVNLYETQQHYIACVDLAGVDKHRIDVELEGLLLTLKGCRYSPTEFDPSSLLDGEAASEEADTTRQGSHPSAPAAKRARVHVMEIDQGQFSRSIELPADADPNAIRARYRDGFLWIHVGKAKG